MSVSEPSAQGARGRYLCPVFRRDSVTISDFLDQHASAFTVVGRTQRRLTAGCLRHGARFGHLRVAAFSPALSSEFCEQRAQFAFGIFVMLIDRELQRFLEHGLSLGTLAKL